MDTEKNPREHVNVITLGSGMRNEWPQVEEAEKEVSKEKEVAKEEDKDKEREEHEKEKQEVVQRIKECEKNE